MQEVVRTQVGMLCIAKDQKVVRGGMAGPLPVFSIRPGMLHTSKN